jgi:hypothetical protein
MEEHAVQTATATPTLVLVHRGSADQDVKLVCQKFLFLTIWAVPHYNYFNSSNARNMTISEWDWHWKSRCCVSVTAFSACTDTLCRMQGMSRHAIDLTKKPKPRYFTTRHQKSSARLHCRTGTTANFWQRMKRCILHYLAQQQIADDEFMDAKLSTGDIIYTIFLNDDDFSDHEITQIWC